MRTPPSTSTTVPAGTPAAPWSLKGKAGLVSVIYNAPNLVWAGGSADAEHEGPVQHGAEAAGWWTGSRVAPRDNDGDPHSVIMMQNSSAPPLRTPCPRCPRRQPPPHSVMGDSFAPPLRTPGAPAVPVANSILSKNNNPPLSHPHLGWLAQTVGPRRWSQSSSRSRGTTSDRVT